MQCQGQELGLTHGAAVCVGLETRDDRPHRRHVLELLHLFLKLDLPLAQLRR